MTIENTLFAAADKMGGSMDHGEYTPGLKVRREQLFTARG